MAAPSIGRQSQWSHILPGIMRNGKPFNRAMTFLADFEGTTDVSTTAHAAKLLLTPVGTGTAIVADKADGWLQSGTSGADNDLNNYQSNGEIFAVEEGRRLIYETKINVDTVALNDLFAGFSVRDATILNSFPADLLGFHIADGTVSQELIFTARKNGTSSVVSTGISMVDAEDIVLRIEVFGRRDEFRAEAWIDGIKKATLKTDLPDDELLAVSFEHRNASAAIRTVQSDYILGAMDRS